MLVLVFKFSGDAWIATFWQRLSVSMETQVSNIFNSIFFWQLFSSGEVQRRNGSEQKLIQETNKKRIKLQFPEEPKEPPRQLLETADLITQTSQLLWKTKRFSPSWMVMTELQNLLLKRRRTFSYPEWKLGELKATTEGLSETWSTTHKTRLPCP